jgi:hypothetical protein
MTLHGNSTQNTIRKAKFCALLHKALVKYLTFSPRAAINVPREQQMRGVVSGKLIQSRTDTVSGPDAFRNRMEQQCHQIKQYRQSMLRESGRLLSPDEAALEWIERYAATFEGGNCGQ